jgi:hypothetical protein
MLAGCERVFTPVLCLRVRRLVGREVGSLLFASSRTYRRHPEVVELQVVL